MKLQRFNWPIWTGFLVSLFAVLSYPFIFVRWPVTRDFPWANLLIFCAAALLMFIGVRRAFAPHRRKRSKVIASILTTLTAAVLGLFVFSFLVAGRWLPAAHGAPQDGQKAPEFMI